MMASGQQQPAYQFGLFELNPHTRELRKHGVKLKLQDQPFQILLLLLEHSGELVTRQEIQKRLWPEDTYVDFDNAINSAVRKLRETLADSSENPRFVETLARRGYRFVAPVLRPPGIPQGEAPSSVVSIEPAEVSAGRLLPAARKLRLLWIACSCTVLLGVMALTLWWWTSKSKDDRHERILPAVPLTGNRGYEEFPTFSSEGTRVAFAWTAPGKQLPNIYVKLLGQGDPIRLTTDPAGDFAPAWSPDGHWIAFLRVHSPFAAAVMLIPSLGAREREVTETSFATDELVRHWDSYTVPPPFLAWSADGEWLLSLEQDAPHTAFSIVRISVATGVKRTLTFPPKETNGDGGLAVSPDGKTLAFTRTRGLFEKDIYAVSLSEDARPVGAPRRLTFDNTEIEGLAWTPDGRSLVFSSNRGGRRELWEISVRPTGGPVRLIAAGDNPYEVAIAREGHHLVYSHHMMREEIWRMPLDRHAGEPAKNFISSTRADVLPMYSPDGRRIAFQSSRSGSPEIWICGADGSQPVQITTLRAWAGSPKWSPDGQKIAFDSNAAGNWNIYVVGAQGGQPVRLTTSKSQDFRPSWSHDGKWIYFCSTRTGQPQVWKIPALGGAALRVTRNGGGVAFESLDGKDLYYTKQQQVWQLWKAPVSGGDETRVLASLLNNNFALTHRGIYFLDGAPSDVSVSLRFLSFATNAVQTLGAVPGSSSNEISVSPDEHWLLFSGNGDAGSELMLIENAADTGQ